MQPEDMTRLMLIREVKELRRKLRFAKQVALAGLDYVLEVEDADAPEIPDVLNTKAMFEAMHID